MYWLTPSVDSILGCGPKDGASLKENNKNMFGKYFKRNKKAVETDFTEHDVNTIQRLMNRFANKNITGTELGVYLALHNALVHIENLVLHKDKDKAYRQKYHQRPEKKKKTDGPLF